MLRMTDWLANECLQAKVPMRVVGGNAGHMRKLARLRYLGLLHRRRWLRALLLLALAPGNAERYILWVADQPLDAGPYFVGRFAGVVAEANYLCVV